MKNYTIVIVTNSNKDDGGDFYKTTAMTYNDVMKKVRPLIREKYNNNIIDYYISEEKFIETI